MAEIVGSLSGLLGFDPVLRLFPPPELVSREEALFAFSFLLAIVLGVGS